MATGGISDITWNDSALRDLLESEHSDVARFLNHAGEQVAQEAKRLAPVSPRGSNGRSSGYLRSAIGHQLGTDAEGVYVDIYSPATTPTGQPYGLFQEVGTSRMSAQPHLRPALDVLR